MTRLDQEPKARPQTLEDVLSLAAAMESEAVTRYAQLAEAMTRRGDHGLAATFEAMREEERDHLAAIERWSWKVTGLPTSKATDTWQLPTEIARSWDEVAGSALLTPYRALGIAVLNEERGFAFYSYVAAHAEDNAVRVAAEQLASEELSHAALLRYERRRAYRRERPRTTAVIASAPTAHEFMQHAHRMERRAAMIHRAISERLAALGNPVDAAALASIADDERKAAAALGSATADDMRASEAIPGLEGCDRTELLRAALAESERVHDTYADAVDHAGTEPVLLAAQEGAGRAVRHLGQVATKLYAAAT